MLLHRGEDGVVGLVGEDARGGVGGHAGGVGLHACDAGTGGFGDGVGGDGGMEVEGHEEGDTGLECLETLLVVESVRDCGYWWCEVRLWRC